MRRDEMVAPLGSKKANPLPAELADFVPGTKSASDSESDDVASHLSC
jgi:hypothetical protein